MLENVRRVVIVVERRGSVIHEEFQSIPTLRVIALAR